MGITLRPLTELAGKFARRAAAAGPDYEAGVKNPTKDWAAETKAAESSYNQGVQDAIARSAFAKGVTEAGSGKWQEKAAKLGVQRFTTGVQAAAVDWQKGFASIAEVLSRIVLPARGPRGAPQNLERVRAVDQALSDARKK